MITHNKYEPRHDKTNNMACAPSEDSDHHGHLPSLIRVFTVRSMDSQGLKCFDSEYSDQWADA